MSLVGMGVCGWRILRARNLLEAAATVEGVASLGVCNVACANHGIPAQGVRSPEFVRTCSAGW
jgi:hypothetical protein